MNNIWTITVLSILIAIGKTNDDEYESQTTQRDLMNAFLFIKFITAVIKLQKWSIKRSLSVYRRVVKTVMKENVAGLRNDS